MDTEVLQILATPGKFDVEEVKKLILGDYSNDLLRIQIYIQNHNPRGEERQFPKKGDCASIVGVNTPTKFIAMAIFTKMKQLIPITFPKDLYTNDLCEFTKWVTENDKVKHFQTMFYENRVFVSMADLCPDGHPLKRFYNIQRELAEIGNPPDLTAALQTAAENYFASL